MRVKELREILKDLPDEMPIVTAGFDHNYVKAAGVSAVPAHYQGIGRFGEWSGEDCVEIYGPKVIVLLIEEY